MLLTQLEYFVALAREQHFGRAAAACHVTQSALSEAIRKLETELGTTLVQRGRTFESLTPEGERVLVWARRMLDDHRALVDEVTVDPHDLSGEVRIGVIPSAIASAAGLLATLTATHPRLRAQCLTSLTSEEIVERIHRFELDAGLIHPSVEGRDSVTITPLSEEPLVIAAAAGLIPGSRTSIGARELADLPLCLLASGMRGRQVLDRRLADEGLVLAPRIEADSIEELLALTRTGPWATAVPASAVADLTHSDVRVYELTEPEVTLSIVLATRSEEPRPAITRAVLAAARR